MKMEIVPQIPKAFEIFDSVAKDAYASDDPDDVLARAYFSTVEVLRQYACTGTNAEKFSEFFYFRYVKYYLEKKLSNENLKVELKKIDNPRTVTKFFSFEHEGKKLILKSDLPIPEAGLSRKPDIFVGIQENERTIRPIAIFEIKVCLREKAINKLIERFKRLKESVIAKFLDMTEKEMPCFAWLYLNHDLYKKNINFSEKIREFCNLSDDNHFVVVHNVTRWDNNNYEPFFTGKINAIMEKIVRKIKAYNYF